VPNVAGSRFLGDSGWPAAVAGVFFCGALAAGANSPFCATGDLHCFWRDAGSSGGWDWGHEARWIMEWGTMGFLALGR
jgi:hypothetical protein